MEFSESWPSTCTGIWKIKGRKETETMHKQTEDPNLCDPSCQHLQKTDGHSAKYTCRKYKNTPLYFHDGPARLLQCILDELKETKEKLEETGEIKDMAEALAAKIDDMNMDQAREYVKQLQASAIYCDRQVSEVYKDITNGRISKISTDASTVLGHADDYQTIKCEECSVLTDLEDQVLEKNIGIEKLIETLIARKACPPGLFREHEKCALKKEIFYVEKEGCVKCWKAWIKEG